MAAVFAHRNTHTRTPAGVHLVIARCNNGRYYSCFFSEQENASGVMCAGPSCFTLWLHAILVWVCCMLSPLGSYGSLCAANGIACVFLYKSTCNTMAVLRARNGLEWLIDPATFW